MAEISETRNSKFETRKPDAFLPYAEERSSRFVARLARARLRFPISDFRFPTLTARCLLPTAFCLLLSAFCLLFFTACGYHVAGTATRIPPNVKTIAVPAFKNMSTTFRIEQQLTSAVTREFLERTHYRVLPNPSEADAVLKGTVKDVRARAITFDINTGRATSLQVQVTADVKLEDLHTHKLLFSNSSYVFREEYQVSESPSALFQEDKPALDRLSRDLARTLVTDILENF
jgi:outer membrane lipopolysaccharide assembly protein LptE/RlpB